MAADGSGAMPVPSALSLAGEEVALRLQSKAAIRLVASSSDEHERIVLESAIGSNVGEARPEVMRRRSLSPTQGALGGGTRRSPSPQPTSPPPPPTVVGVSSESVGERRFSPPKPPSGIGPPFSDGASTSPATTSRGGAAVTGEVAAGGGSNTGAAKRNSAGSSPPPSTYRTARSMSGGTYEDAMGVEGGSFDCDDRWSDSDIDSTRASFSEASHKSMNLGDFGDHFGVSARSPRTASEDLTASPPHDTSGVHTAVQVSALGCSSDASACGVEAECEDDGRGSTTAHSPRSVDSGASSLVHMDGMDDFTFLSSAAVVTGGWQASKQGGVGVADDSLFTANQGAATPQAGPRVSGLPVRSGSSRTNVSSSSSREMMPYGVDGSVSSPSPFQPDLEASRSLMQSYREELAALESQLGAMRGQVREMEERGRGINDANARVAREVKLRQVLEVSRKEVELRVEELTAELREFEASRMLSEKAASENADVAHAWKDRCESFEAAYKTLQATHAACQEQVMSEQVRVLQLEKQLATLRSAATIAVEAPSVPTPAVDTSSALRGEVDSLRESLRIARNECLAAQNTSSLLVRELEEGRARGDNLTRSLDTLRAERDAAQRERRNAWQLLSSALSTIGGYMHSVQVSQTQLRALKSGRATSEEAAIALATPDLFAQLQAATSATSSVAAEAQDAASGSCTADTATVSRFLSCDHSLLSAALVSATTACGWTVESLRKDVAEAEASSRRVLSQAGSESSIAVEYERRLADVTAVFETNMAEARSRLTAEHQAELCHLQSEHSNALQRAETEAATAASLIRSLESALSRASQSLPPSALSTSSESGEASKASGSVAAHEAAVSELKRAHEAALESRSKLVREWEEYANHWESRGREAERMNGEWETAFDKLQAEYSKLSQRHAEAVTTVDDLRLELTSLRSQVSFTQHTPSAHYAATPSVTPSTPPLPMTAGGSGSIGIASVPESSLPERPLHRYASSVSGSGGGGSSSPRAPRSASFASFPVDGVDATGSTSSSTYPTGAGGTTPSSVRAVVTSATAQASTSSRLAATNVPRIALARNSYGAQVTLSPSSRTTSTTSTATSPKR